MNLSDASKWNRTASDYEDMPIEGPIFIPCTKMLGAMNSALPFSSAKAILDIGCGPGTAITLLFKEYAESIPGTAKVTATDFSEGMVEATRSRKEKQILSARNDVASCWGRLELDVVDAQNLGRFGDDSMSHVMGSLVYFMLPEPRKGLAETRRVLVDDGVFACTSWAKVGWVEVLAQAAQVVRPETKPAIEMPVAWRTTEAVKTELEAVGFRHVHTEYVEVDWHFEDPKTFVKTFKNNPGMERVFGHLNEEEVTRCFDEWVRIVRENGNVCKGVAVLGVGRK